MKEKQKAKPGGHVEPLVRPRRKDRKAKVNIHPDVTKILNDHKARLICPYRTFIVHVPYGTEKHLFTGFGTFRKDNLEWICDSKFKLEAIK